MNKDRKIREKTKAKNRTHIPDLEAKKDPKGGIIAVLIGMLSPSPPPPPTPPTTK